jgi:hypothetical protein
MIYLYVITFNTSKSFNPDAIEVAGFQVLRASTPVMIYPHRASCKICQTTVGIKPATFGLLDPGSVSRGLNIIVDDIVILYKHRMILLVDKISDILLANQMIMKYTLNISILKLGI